MREISDIEKEIDLVDEQMVRLCFSGSRDSLDYASLRCRKDILKEELSLAFSNLVVVSDEIDIYEQRIYKDNYRYYVVPHDTLCIAGLITVDYGRDYDRVLGNVGYQINNEFRGRGYARKALELLCGVFVDKGMEVSVIVIKQDNIPSIKTTKGFGGILVRKAENSYGYDTYNVDIRQKVKNRQLVCK